MDFFRVLGVPASYALDLGAAEARFRDLARQFHPDRFAKADPRARRASLQRSVQLNEAWRTIKDPVRRAEYVLQRAGYPIGADEAGTRPQQGDGEGVASRGGGPPRVRVAVPPALLGEILELREELGDARATGDDARVQEMATGMRGRIDAALARVAHALGRNERDGDASAQAWEAVTHDLIAIRYFRRFLDEVAAHEEASAAGLEGMSHA